MKCNRLNCTAEATCIPRVSFTALGRPDTPRGQLSIGLPLCEEHAIPQVDLYLTAQGWAELTQVMRDAGKRAPDPASAEVDFIPIPNVFADGNSPWSADITGPSQ